MTTTNKLAQSPAEVLGDGFVHTFDDSNPDSYPGLTLRQHFAGLAMQGVLANPTGEPSGDFEKEHFAKVVAVMAVRHADALLAALASDGGK